MRRCCVLCAVCCVRPGAGCRRPLLTKGEMLSWVEVHSAASKSHPADEAVAVRQWGIEQAFGHLEILVADASIIVRAAVSEATAAAV